MHRARTPMLEQLTLANQRGLKGRQRDFIRHITLEGHPGLHAHTLAHWNDRPTAESAEKGPQSGRDENERESHRGEENVHFFLRRS